MAIRQRLNFIFICASIWGVSIGCIAIAINSKTQSLVSRVDRHIAIEAHSSSMEQLAKHAQSLVAADL
ncbi:MAG: hypothetical protein N4J56_005017 [Chroococcidiopsis sp. SAG 2025]|uniref:hypothetical protein n=1 Tax=Chroococcidiopsis sp. SAG 2025 TaxID=171389 RepID=UPI0029370089|nr:hypothetical protein [Chroococcidiopsis sp. SAG 2025]MDV2995363.1 hypothetical protein [Chroococcidiopsis sp. SAG 2025]